MIRNILLVFILGLITRIQAQNIDQFPVHAADSGINFEVRLTWQQIKDKAKAENKFIFVDCYATWC
ncbi:MAG: hypothetical protein J7497_08925, partial [Chitinophagaceae bacterium]|nr:hypothetical protein [Chitinophagaceae bacterium]